MLDPLQYYFRVLHNGIKTRFRTVMIAHPGPGTGLHKWFMWQIIILPTAEKGKGGCTMTSRYLWLWQVRIPIWWRWAAPSCCDASKCVNSAYTAWWKLWKCDSDGYGVWRWISPCADNPIQREAYYERLGILECCKGQVSQENYWCFTKSLLTYCQASP